MKRLLLLLPLMLATPVLAESDPFGLGEHAFKRFKQHSDNFYKAEDLELSCSEIRMASTVIKTQLNLLQQYKPEVDWLRQWNLAKGFIADSCAPYGH